MSAQLDTYTRFTRALANADSVTMRHCVSDDFWVALEREEGPQLVGLDFAHFVRELERQRVAFPDLGHHVAGLSVAEEENILRASYIMTVTFSGLLMSTGGTSLQGDGRKVLLHQTDHVIFENEVIASFVVHSRMTEALTQMFPDE